uniref:Tyrosine-protein kinase ephrin type A/B receptor-like domain-containing protein n=1 Tax=Chromera velia CCMP2878 TaxID=1169474 RepID=A0A0G4GGJ9_9ALVE|eukprot:Cvel_4685.t1-p1 / transcript=Cvel_4685.t1 / gene=Cvel_4685 / organism=Chromera_velia_CCMP2878 / gene_product=Signal peptide, CUB and EGF-like domain-containing, putative / transcript_product=Signal peptide, CUB and EGF-like domain-containing, putative / location=Cvel_scaffold207:86587-115296(-) / protein_length=2653 / sequence_SO=supercontig / SO=protein_coding / is_pseudo=false
MRGSISSTLRYLPILSVLFAVFAKTVTGNIIDDAFTLYYKVVAPGCDHKFKYYTETQIENVFGGAYDIISKFEPESLEPPSQTRSEYITEKKETVVGYFVTYENTKFGSVADFVLKVFVGNPYPCTGDAPCFSTGVSYAFFPVVVRFIIVGSLAFLCRDDRGAFKTVVGAFSQIFGLNGIPAYILGKLIRLIEIVLDPLIKVMDLLVKYGGILIPTLILNVLKIIRAFLKVIRKFLVEPLLTPIDSTCKRVERFNRLLRVLLKIEVVYEWLQYLGSGARWLLLPLAFANPSCRKERRLMDDNLRLALYAGVNPRPSDTVVYPVPNIPSPRDYFAFSDVTDFIENVGDELNNLRRMQEEDSGKKEDATEGPGLEIEPEALRTFWRGMREDFERVNQLGQADQSEAELIETLQKVGGGKSEKRQEQVEAESRAFAEDMGLNDVSEEDADGWVEIAEKFASDVETLLPVLESVFQRAEENRRKREEAFDDVHFNSHFRGYENSTSSTAQSECGGVSQTGGQCSLSRDESFFVTSQRRLAALPRPQSDSSPTLRRLEAKFFQWVRRISAVQGGEQAVESHIADEIGESLSGKRRLDSYDRRLHSRLLLEKGRGKKDGERRRLLESVTKKDKRRRLQIDFDATVRRLGSGINTWIQETRDTVTLAARNRGGSPQFDLIFDLIQGPFNLIGSLHDIFEGVKEFFNGINVKFVPEVVVVIARFANAIVSAFSFLDPIAGILEGFGNVIEKIKCPDFLGALCDLVAFIGDALDLLRVVVPPFFVRCEELLERLLEPVFNLFNPLDFSEFGLELGFIDDIQTFINETVQSGEQYFEDQIVTPVVDTIRGFLDVGQIFTAWDGLSSPSALIQIPEECIGLDRSLCGKKGGRITQHEASTTGAALITLNCEAKIGTATLNAERDNPYVVVRAARRTLFGFIQNIQPFVVLPCGRVASTNANPCVLDYAGNFPPILNGDPPGKFADEYIEKIENFTRDTPALSSFRVNELSFADHFQATFWCVDQNAELELLPDLFDYQAEQFNEFGAVNHIQTGRRVRTFRTDARQRQAKGGGTDKNIFPEDSASWAVRNTAIQCFSRSIFIDNIQTPPPVTLLFPGSVAGNGEMTFSQGQWDPCHSPWFLGTSPTTERAALCHYRWSLYWKVLQAGGSASASTAFGTTFDGGTSTVTDAEQELFLPFRCTGDASALFYPRALFTTPHDSLQCCRDNSCPDDGRCNFLSGGGIPFLNQIPDSDIDTATCLVNRRARANCDRDGDKFTVNPENSVQITGVSDTPQQFAAICPGGSGSVRANCNDAACYCCDGCGGLFLSGDQCFVGSSSLSLDPFLLLTLGVPFGTIIDALVCVVSNAKVTKQGIVICNGGCGDCKCDQQCLVFSGDSGVEKYVSVCDTGFAFSSTSTDSTFIPCGATAASVASRSVARTNRINEASAFTAQNMGGDPSNCENAIRQLCEGASTCDLAATNCFPYFMQFSCVDPEFIILALGLQGSANVREPFDYAWQASDSDSTVAVLQCPNNANVQLIEATYGNNLDNIDVTLPLTSVCPPQASLTNCSFDITDVRDSTDPRIADNLGSIDTSVGILKVVGECYCGEGKIPELIEDPTVGLRCDLCPAGTYRGPFDANCIDCLPGTFSFTPGASFCPPCPEGTAGIGTEECTACQEGEFQPLTGQTTCNICPKNTFAATRGSTSCQPCDPGFQTPGDGADECIPCSIGTFKTTNAPDAECESCPCGTFATLNATECTPCSPGYFQPAERQGNCLECPQGFFQGMEGACDCDACEDIFPGFYTETARSTSEADCSIREGIVDWTLFGLEVCRTLSGDPGSAIPGQECETAPDTTGRRRMLHEMNEWVSVGSLQKIGGSKSKHEGADGKKRRLQISLDSGLDLTNVTEQVREETCLAMAIQLTTLTSEVEEIVNGTTIVRPATIDDVLGLGNGICQDDFHNTFWCFFDRGDCCESSCVDLSLEAGDADTTDMEFAEFLQTNPQAASAMLTFNESSDALEDEVVSYSCRFFSCRDPDAGDIPQNCTRSVENPNGLPEECLPCLVVLPEQSGNCPGDVDVTRIGDGICDDMFNFAGSPCEFDGGDCCESTCRFRLPGDCEPETFVCRDPSAGVDEDGPEILFVPSTDAASRRVDFALWPEEFPPVTARDNFPCFDPRDAVIATEVLIYSCPGTTGDGRSSIGREGVIFSALRTFVASDISGNSASSDYVIEVTNDIIDTWPNSYPVPTGARACLSPANRRYIPFEMLTTTNGDWGLDTALGIPRSLLAFGATVRFVSCVSEYAPTVDTDDVPPCVYNQSSDTLFVPALGGAGKGDNVWNITLEVTDECNLVFEYVTQVFVYDKLPRTLPEGLYRCYDMKTDDRVLDDLREVEAKAAELKEMLEEEKQREKERLQDVRGACTPDKPLSQSRCLETVKDTFEARKETLQAVTESSKAATRDYVENYSALKEAERTARLEESRKRKKFKGIPMLSPDDIVTKEEAAATQEQEIPGGPLERSEVDGRFFRAGLRPPGGEGEDGKSVFQRLTESLSGGFKLDKLGDLQEFSSGGMKSFGVSSNENSKKSIFDLRFPKGLPASLREGLDLDDKTEKLFQMEGGKLKLDFENLMVGGKKSVDGAADGKEMNGAEESGGTERKDPLGLNLGALFG